MLRSILTFSLSVLAITTLVFIISQPPKENDEPRTEIKTKNILPQAIVNNPHTKTFDEYGKLSTSIVADKLEYFKNTAANSNEADFSFVTNPKLQFKDQQQAWLLTAEQGILQDYTSSAVFSGNVVLMQTAPTTDKTILETETLDVFIDQKYAETNDRVTISSPYGKMDATGMRVDFNQQKIELKQGVTGTHEPI